jgi:hypothetical protein
VAAGFAYGGRRVVENAQKLSRKLGKVYRSANLHEIFTFLLTFAVYCVKIFTYPQNP